MQGSSKQLLTLDPSSSNVASQNMKHCNSDLGAPVLGSILVASSLGLLLLQVQPP